MCFAYGPSVGGGQLAGTATKALGVAPILAQLAFLSLGLVRRELSPPLAGVQLIGLTTSLLGLVTGIILPASKPKVNNTIIINLIYLNINWLIIIFMFNRSKYPREICQLVILFHQF